MRKKVDYKAAEGKENIFIVTDFVDNHKEINLDSTAEEMFKSILIPMNENLIEAVRQISTNPPQNVE